LANWQVDLMVRLCLRISAERGNELVVDGQWLVREDGTRTALGPLARQLSLLDSEQEWVDAINQRYDVLAAVTSRGATLVGGPTDDIVARAHLRLRPSGAAFDANLVLVFIAPAMRDGHELARKKRVQDGEKKDERGNNVERLRHCATH